MRQAGNMPVYRIADLNIKIIPRSRTFQRQLKDFKVNDDYFDFEVSITREDIKYERLVYAQRNQISSDVPFSVCESLAVYRHICRKILSDYNGMLLHSAAIEYKGYAYLFSAPSGTGKTTHIRLWKELLGDKALVINGDKPILRLINDKIIVYGTPWKGKENYGSDKNAPLKAVFFLKRAEKNSVCKADVKSVLPLIMAQTLRYGDKDNVDKLLLLIEKIISDTDIYILNCNMDISAAEAAVSAVDSEYPDKSMC